MLVGINISQSLHPRLFHPTKKRDGLSRRIARNLSRLETPSKHRGWWPSVSSRGGSTLGLVAYKKL